MAVGPEETQVHPERNRLASDLIARGGFEAAQDRVPDPGDVIRSRVVAEGWEQRAKAQFVLFDGRVPEAAVLSKPVQERIQMIPTLRVAFCDRRRRDDIPVRQERGKTPEPRHGIVCTGEPDRPVEEPGMNAGAVVGEKAAPNALVGCRQGNVRQVEPDEEVTAQVPARNEHRTRVSLHFQELPELHGEMSSGLDLRRHLRVPDLEQMPEEADRKISLIRSGPLADPMPARAMAYMAHEAVNQADVERFQAKPAGRQPDRDMPGRAGQRADIPVRMAKAFQTICVAPDSTGIALRNHIGERRAESLGSHGISPVSVKTDRSGADSYVNLISGIGV